LRSGAAARYAKIRAKVKLTLTARLAIGMILLVTTAVFACGWLSYRSLEPALGARLAIRLQIYTNLIASRLQGEVGGVRAYITGVRSRAAVNGMALAYFNGGFDPIDHIQEADWRARVGERMLADLSSNPTYTQFRLIRIDDDGPRELLRIERSGPDEALRVVSEAELISQGQMPGLKEAINLNEDDIYVSPIDLRDDGGVGQTPTMRVAAPIFTPGGKRFGFVMVSIDMQPALDRVRSAARAGIQIYLVDGRGDYLVDSESKREFGSKSGMAANWAADFPSLAPFSRSTKGNEVISPDEAGQSGALAMVPVLLASKQWVGVIGKMPHELFVAPAAILLNTSTRIGLIAVFFAGASAFFFARSQTRPIRELTTAVEAMGRTGTFKISLESAGETGILARAFARVMSDVNAKTAALEREIQEHRWTEMARDRHAQRESLFSAAVESSNDAIIMKSLDGTITGWNAAAERMFGYAASEVIGRSIDLIMPAERLPELHDILRRVGRGEKIEHHETVHLHRDGRQIDVSVGISAIRTPSGAIIGASNTARDITEAKRTQRKLNQEIEERRRIFDTSQDLILITDPKGVLVQVSPSALAILGYLPNEMTGRRADLFVHNDDIDDTREQLRAARLGRAAHSFDSRLIHKDGRMVTLSWVGTWSEPVKRYFFIGRDMTESRRAQATLRESEQLAHGIIDTALDAFVQIDADGSILDWNTQAEKIFGWPRTEALGQNFIELAVVDADREKLRSGLRSVLNARTDHTVGRRHEILSRRRDGSEFTAELSVTALSRRGGFVFNGFFRDLTDKIAAEERLRQAEKMEALGQLTGGIAHDFNNILTVITGTIEILAGAVEKEPQLAAITRMIDAAAVRGANLTQQLLAFARKQPLQPQETDVNTLIIDTIKMLRTTLGEQIEIESIFEDDCCVATVDPNQLATAILNLSINARDAMPDGGKLILETGMASLDENYVNTHDDVRPGRYVLIAVSDTGTGIAPDKLDKVFNPFFTSKGPGKGTGLGLSMVYGFVKQSAGHIKIYSEEGHGTTIKMYLPPGSGAARSSDMSGAPSLQGGQETILVVEDDKLVRDYVLTQLHSLGYVTLDAGNAAEALALVEAGHAFDLLFTDMIMPGAMNGRQLADEIESRRPGLKVLYTSGYTENAIIHHGRLDSGVLLLAKPYRKSDMAAMIRRALAN